MDTRLLRMFCAVAGRGSVVAAARELHVTPSAISHALRALEDDLGCRLFERIGKKILLNQAGEQFLALVQPPMLALDAAGESMKKLGEWGQTRLRIGAAASACQCFLPGIIRELKKAHPKLILQVESGDMPEMVELLRLNRLDLALGVTPENQEDLEVRPVFKDELLFVFAPGHPWAEARSITREELRTQPFILYQRKSFTFRLVEEYFQVLNLVPSTVMEVASIEAIKELVKLGLGVSLLAPWTVEKELSRGSLMMRPIGPRILRREWAVACLKGRRLNLPEESFRRLCRNYASGLRLDRRDLPAAITVK